MIKGRLQKRNLDMGDSAQVCVEEIDAASRDSLSESCQFHRRTIEYMLLLVQSQALDSQALLRFPPHVFDRENRPCFRSHYGEAVTRQPHLGREQGFATLPPVSL